MENWERHEQDINELLGLSRTLASGSQWHDPGDGVDRDYHSPFPLMVDAKSTVRGSYTVNAKFMAQMSRKALSAGKIFALPIRFLRADRTHDDYIVIGLHDFVALLDLAKGNRDAD